MNKKITPDQYASLAAEFDLEVAMIKALVSTFGLSDGFTADGSIVIHFEPFHYHRYTGTRLNTDVTSQSTQKKAYDAAFGLNPKVTQLSTSFGILPLLGKYHVHAGYQTPAQMIDDFMLGEYQQIRGFLNYVKSTEYSSANLYDALKRRDFASFASFHAGPYYKRQDLHNIFQSNFKRQLAYS